MTEVDLAEFLKRGQRVQRAVDDGSTKHISEGMRAYHARRKEYSEIEEQMALEIKLLKVPVPERQYKPLAHRHFRADFCWPEQMLILEVQGNVHRIKKSFEQGWARHNLLTWHGWKLYYVTGKMIRSGAAATLVNTIFGMPK